MGEGSEYSSPLSPLALLLLHPTPAGSSYYGTTPGDGLGQLGDRSVTSSRAEGLAQLGDETEGELMRGDSVSSAASSMSSQPSTVQQ